MPTIAFAGNKTTTFEAMKQFLMDSMKIDLLLTLTPMQGEKHNVAGYKDLRPFAKEYSIPIYHPKSYSLKAAEDQTAHPLKNIDILLVIGWQRLIPEWLLDSLKFGAFGMHGSPEPLPRGRGRSPINWALSEDKKSFTTNLFRYDSGIDSGQIVGYQKFDINNWDDCDSLHLKNRIAMNRLLKIHLPSILNNTAKFTPQDKNISPTYYAKRTAESGRILWDSMDMIRLYNHIRCQTLPFPGAFSHLNGNSEKIHFWKGVPFDSHITWHGTQPGIVVEVFNDGSFLVTVLDGSLRIINYTSFDDKSPRKGHRFHDFPLTNN
jgi:methionyl-tRNA formyltransferase